MRSDKYKLFEASVGAKITAYIQQPFAWDSKKITAHGVSWPSIGRVPTEDARQFAETIIRACDWLDEQKENDNARPTD